MYKYTHIVIVLSILGIAPLALGDRPTPEIRAARALAFLGLLFGMLRRFSLGPL